MDKAKKKQIDNIWLNSDLGKWAVYKSTDDTDMAKAIEKKIVDSGYYAGVAMLEAELGNQILSFITKAEEWDEYLHMLYEDDPVLVMFMVQSGLFNEYVFDKLYQRR